jgi:2'-5' RNA ligase
MPRLFVAIWPPPSVLDALEALPRLPLAGARWTTRQQWHITLRFLGQADVEMVTRAFDAVSAVAAEVTLGPRPRALGRSVLVLPVAGLDQIAAAVELATANVGRPPERRPFRGHLTLARATNGALPKPSFEMSASWRVEELALVESHTHPAGAVYDTLHVRALA